MIRMLAAALLSVVLPVAHATYFDKETGTYYNMRRDYSPEEGRYIQSDPVGLSGGLNTYVYVKNSPLQYIDPFGLCAATPNMLNCLKSIFGQDVDWVNVIIDPPMIERHFGPGKRGATTRTGTVYINMSCDEFWGSPDLVLHEYYHVVQQWGAEGMTVPGYLMQFWIKEREARDFAARNLKKLKDCLSC